MKKKTFAVQFTVNSTFTNTLLNVFYIVDSTTPFKAIKDAKKILLSDISFSEVTNVYVNQI